MRRLTLGRNKVSCTFFAPHRISDELWISWITQDTRVSWKCQHPPPPPPAWPRGHGSPCSEPRQSQDTLHWTGVKVTCCTNQGSVTWSPQPYRAIKSWPRLISPFFPPKLPLGFCSRSLLFIVSAVSLVCWCGVTATKYRVNVRCKMNKRNSNQLSAIFPCTVYYYLSN